MNVAIDLGDYKIDYKLNGMGIRALAFARCFAELCDKVYIFSKQIDTLEHTQGFENILYIENPGSRVKTGIFNESDYIYFNESININEIQEIKKGGVFIFDAIVRINEHRFNRRYLSLNEDMQKKDYENIVKKYMQLCEIATITIHGSKHDYQFKSDIIDNTSLINYDYTTIEPFCFDFKNHKEKLRIREKTDEMEFVWNGGTWNHFDSIPFIKASNKFRNVTTRFLYLSNTQHSEDIKNNAKINRSVKFPINKRYEKADSLNYEKNAFATVLFYKNTTENKLNQTYPIRFHKNILYDIPIVIDQRSLLADIVKRYRIGWIAKNEEPEIEQTLMQINSETESGVNKETLEKSFDQLRKKYELIDRIKTIIKLAPPKSVKA